MYKGIKQIHVCLCNIKPLVKFAYQKINFLISPPKHHIVGTQKNRLNDLDGSFEHPKHMLKVMGKKIFTILR